jgi:hypothetical protein
MIMSFSSHLEGVKPLVAAGTIVAGGTFRSRVYYHLLLLSSLFLFPSTL